MSDEVEVRIRRASNGYVLWSTRVGDRSRSIPPLKNRVYIAGPEAMYSLKECLRRLFDNE